MHSHVWRGVAGGSGSSFLVLRLDNLQSDAMAFEPLYRLGALDWAMSGESLSPSPTSRLADMWRTLGRELKAQLNLW